MLHVRSPCTLVIVSLPRIQLLPISLVRRSSSLDLPEWNN